MLEEILAALPPVRVVPYDLTRERVTVFDFTAENDELAALDLADTAAFSRYVFDVLGREDTRIGIGRHGEDRTIYARSGLFDGQEARTVHLGIDLWAKAATPVLAALAGTVHSTADNDRFGDYGPTIILEHHLEGETFYTLYGHLDRDSLGVIGPGTRVSAGEMIARIGTEEENGQWPPHLHFMLIRDLEGRRGDFPGVCAASNRDRYLALCPDPNLALKIPGLG
jgi:murein DD-endopeptidase MepM/ murein hydrolase activator NlpD